MCPCFCITLAPLDYSLANILFCVCRFSFLFWKNNIIWNPKFKLNLQISRNYTNISFNLRTYCQKKRMKKYKWGDSCKYFLKHKFFLVVTKLTNILSSIKRLFLKKLIHLHFFYTMNLLETFKKNHSIYDNFLYWPVCV